jgi:hypothetical protein
LASILEGCQAARRMTVLKVAFVAAPVRRSSGACLPSRQAEVILTAVAREVRSGNAGPLLSQRYGLRSIRSMEASVRFSPKADIRHARLLRAFLLLRAFA